MKKFTFNSIVRSAVLNHVASKNLEGGSFEGLTRVADDYSCTGEDREQYEWAQEEFKQLGSYDKKHIKLVEKKLKSDLFIVHPCAFQNDLELYKMIDSILNPVAELTTSEADIMDDIIDAGKPLTAPALKPHEINARSWDIINSYLATLQTTREELLKITGVSQTLLEINQKDIDRCEKHLAVLGEPCCWCHAPWVGIDSGDGSGNEMCSVCGGI